MRYNPLMLVCVAAMLVIGTGSVVAVGDGDSHVYGEESEKDPWCEDGQEALSSDKLPVDQDASLEFEDSRVLYVCSGEQWDGQDPHSQSDEESIDTVGATSGDLYVNILGDESGDSARDKPTTGDPVQARTTGDLNADDGDVGVFNTLDLFGVGVSREAVYFDSASGNGYAAVYLEDNTDQVFGQSFPGDGNMLANIVDYAQAGVVAEGDCDQDTYQNSPTTCRRDNTAATVEFGVGWALP